jgi:hypothetical protein
MPATSDPLLAAFAVLSVALLAAVVVLVMWVGRIASRVAAAGGDQRVLQRLDATERDLAAAVRRIEHLGNQQERLADQAPRCLQRVGLVRYDAFKELGGHLSFSVALLDAHRNGIVLSVLNDREGARAYAKPVAGGRSTFNLSEEEERAITGT